MCARKVRKAMKQIITITLSLSLFGLVSVINPTQIRADEASQNQELEQECEVICETGAYGQDTSCTTKCYQHGEQEQTITLRDGTVLAAHTPVETALDTKTSLVVAGLLASGLAAFVARKKLV